MTAQRETVADVFAEIVSQAIGDVSTPLRSMIRPQIGKATEAMTRNPERTRELLLLWVPRLCRAAEISPGDLMISDPELFTDQNLD